MLMNSSYQVLLIFLLCMVSLSCLDASNNTETCDDTRPPLTGSFERRFQIIFARFEHQFQEMFVEKQMVTIRMLNELLQVSSDLDKLSKEYTNNLTILPKNDIYWRYLRYSSLSYIKGLVDLINFNENNFNYYLRQPKNYFEGSALDELKMLENLTEMTKEMARSVEYYYSNRSFCAVMVGLDFDWKQYQSNRTNSELGCKLNNVFYNLYYRASTLTKRAEGLLSNQSGFITLPTQLKMLQNINWFFRLEQLFQEYKNQLHENSTKLTPKWAPNSDVCCYEPNEYEVTTKNLLENLLLFMNLFNSVIVHKQPDRNLSQIIEHHLAELESMRQEILHNQSNHPVDDLRKHFHYIDHLALIEINIELEQRVASRLTFYQSQPLSYFENTSPQEITIKRVLSQIAKYNEKVILERFPIRCLSWVDQLDSKWQRMDHGLQAQELQNTLSDLQKAMRNFRKEQFDPQWSKMALTPHLYLSIGAEFDVLFYELNYSKRDAFYSKYLKVLQERQLLNSSSTNTTI